MIRIVLCFSIIFCSSQFVFSQTAEDSVKTVINNLFLGMKNADTNLLKQAFADSAILQTIAGTKDGKIVVRTDDLKGFIDFVGKQKKDAADEQISFESIKIDGALASVWTPYKFYFNGQFSHCGANSFQLVRINKEWKIQYLIDTRRRQPCD
jgi:hypothetical protein